MEHITAAGNTEIPAYLVLLHEGCRVERQTHVDGGELWVAQQDDLRISGAGPLEVLGLYYMRRQRGENWQAKDSEIEAFMQRFYPEGTP